MGVAVDVPFFAVVITKTFSCVSRISVAGNSYPKSQNYTLRN